MMIWAYTAKRAVISKRGHFELKCIKMYLATGLRPDAVRKLEHFPGLLAMKQAALWCVGMGDGRRNSWELGTGRRREGREKRGR